MLTILLHLAHFQECRKRACKLPIWLYLRDHMFTSAIKQHVKAVYLVLYQ